RRRVWRLRPEAGEPWRVAEQRPPGGDCVRRAEPGPQHDPQTELRPSHDAEAHQWAPPPHLERAGVALHAAPDLAHQQAELALPRAALARQRELARTEVDDRVDQLVLVAEVNVERHRRHAELAREPPHAETLDALAVRQLESGARDPLAGESGRRRGGSTRPSGHRWFAVRRFWQWCLYTVLYGV